MGDILLDNQTAPASNPASGKTLIFTDAVTKRIISLNDAGGFGGRQSGNDASASQGAGFASDTYVTNSGILIPSFGMKPGQLFRWLISLSKTAAGTNAAIITVRSGSLQTTGDTSRLVLTQVIAQTAALASGILTVIVGVRNVGASGVLAGGFGFSSSVGLGGGADGVSASFDNSAMGGLYLGLSINGGGTAAWTITHVTGDLFG